ncbi:MAG TPA: hypothetical protein VFW06_00415 [Acidimicrobiia bacterium]|nr:hypothetical protein [Acidimicrobiia bacterium]
MWWRRSDGTLVRDLPKTRRVMPYLMRGRNEAAVNFEQEIALPKADAFIRAWNQANPMLRIDVFHLACWGLKEVFERVPSTHRFVAGGRLYDRHGIWFSYAVKQKLETGAPMVVIKRRFDTDESFGAMVAGMAATQADFKAGAEKRVDRELGLLFVFPGFVRRLVMAAIRGLDRLGMLPRSYIEHDPMYASAFFANMASLGMPAVFHHLYEYGTCGIFSSLGRPVTVPGSPTSGPDRERTMTVRWTYDERVDDGLAAWFGLRRFKQVIEDPEGCGLIVEALPDGAVERDPDDAVPSDDVLSSEDAR